MTALLSVAAPDDEVSGHLTCVAVRRETHDVLSADLRLDAPLRFRPGQHLTVTVETDGGPMSRCYSIASSAERPDGLTLTVKRVADGPVSAWLHDHLAVGGRLHVEGPLGDFSVDTHAADRPLLLSAGSGITPMMSMLRTLVDRGHDDDVVFVHSARTPDDIIFRRELEELARERPGVRVAVVCEADSPTETWGGLRGRLTADMLAMLVPDLADREVYVCGPRPYMDAVEGLAAGLGADPGRCHREDFVLGGAPPPSEAAAGPASAVRFEVQFARTGARVVCEPGETLLAAARRAGLCPPTSCEEGVCGTCKTLKLSGEVDLRHQGGIRPREIAAGSILLCCSTPESDVVLDA